MLKMFMLSFLSNNWISKNLKIKKLSCRASYQFIKRYVVCQLMLIDHLQQPTTTKQKKKIEFFTEIFFITSSYKRSSYGTLL